MTPYDLAERLEFFAKSQSGEVAIAMNNGAALIKSLRDELACTYEELIDHVGDDMGDTRRNRIAALRHPRST